MIPITIIDGFLENPNIERAKALKSNFSEAEHHGVKYPGISFCEDQLSYDRISERLGLSLEKWLCMFRIYYKNDLQPGYIHCDVSVGGSMGDISGILFLNETKKCMGGLSFWKHKKTGFFRHPTVVEDPEKFYSKMNKEGLIEDLWQMIEYVPMKFNRLVLFDTALYHSRYPKEAFGNSLDSARIIKVFFCQVKK